MSLYEWTTLFGSYKPDWPDSDLTNGWIARLTTNVINLDLRPIMGQSDLSKPYIVHTCFSFVHALSAKTRSSHLYIAYIVYTIFFIAHIMLYTV